MSIQLTKIVHICVMIAWVRVQHQSLHDPPNRRQHDQALTENIVLNYLHLILSGAPVFLSVMSTFIKILQFAFTFLACTYISIVSAQTADFPTCAVPCARAAAVLAKCSLYAFYSLNIFLKVLMGPTQLWYHLSLLAGAWFLAFDVEVLSTRLS